MPQLAKDTPEKICKRCGKPFNRRRYGNRLEDYSRYMTRQYCSRSCGAARNRKPKSLRAINKYLRQRYLKTHCEKCESTKKLQIHHLDENWRNNSPENLQTLCQSCHMKLHWRLWKSRRNTKHFVPKSEKNPSKPTETQ